MRGRSEVRRLQRRVDDVLQRATAATDEEVRSDLSRYLCVLISGWFENSLAELLLEFSRRNAAVPVQNYLTFSLERLTNVNKERLLQTLGAFDQRWREEFDQYIVDKREAALSTIIALRNDVAHGGGATVSYARVVGYYRSIEEIMDKLIDHLDPPP